VTDPIEAHENELYWDVPLPYRRELPVLGVRVCYSSNSEAILPVVDGRFARWASIPRELIGAGLVHVRFILHEGKDVAAGPITYRMPDDKRFLLHTAGSFGLVDIERRDAVAYVSSALVSDVEHFGYGIVEAITLLLVARQDRQPVHAAMIARGAVGLLLAGPTGVGKSTLAYAAHEAGYRVLSDDSVYVQRRPELRIWGTPGTMYLLAEARRHFPSVKQHAERLPSGKEKVVIDLGSVWDNGAPVVKRAGVCLLTRDGGAILQDKASPEEAREFLRKGLGTQTAWYRASLPSALSALCATGAWRLNLSSDPRDALPYIERMLAETELRSA
jgi:hypothetical protein